ncbi:MAG: PTS sugar transporter subunit IIC [Elusimicrobiota bacterium]
MNILIVSLLGGIITSDSIALGEFMISRPIFCGPLIGLLFGDITTGLYVGMILELIWLTILPLGNSVPPDSTVVTISAAFLGIINGGGSDLGYIMFLIFFLIPAGIVFKKIDIIHRDFNSFFSHKLEEKIEDGIFKYVDRTIYLSTLLFILKAGMFIGLLIVIGKNIFPYIYEGLSFSIREAMAELFYVVPSIGLGSIIASFLLKNKYVKKLSRK